MIQLVENDAAETGTIYITFDCYGTLIDWERGIADAFRRAGYRGDPESLLEAYHREEPLVETQAYRSYAKVLAETAYRVAQQMGWSLSREEASFLPASLPSWEPYPDTNPALESLRGSGYRLGILSNVDDELLGQTCRHFTVSFDLMVTAQQVRSYKPAHGHFLAARERIGGQKWLHAAQSYFHDVVPATELEIPVAWINRKQEKPTGAARATAEFADLNAFAAWMEQPPKLI
jgi:2-haloalkanoic acid dehalogenase type II